MSTDRRAGRFSLGDEATVGPRTFRSLALVAVLVLTASYVNVLRDVTATVGGTRSLLTLVIVMLAAATVLARTIGPRTAAVGAGIAAFVGFGYYLSAVGMSYGAALGAADQYLSDTITLVTGLEILRMLEAGVWTLGFAPGPVFLSWYLALRGRYVPSAAVGGGALLFLVLTGDAGPGMTLLGTVSAIAVVGFGELERRDGSLAQVDVLAVLFALMIVLSLTATVVPGGTANPAFVFESDEDGTLEGSTTVSPDRSTIGGPVDLSPEVRFTVRSDEGSHWRTGVYDRYTGEGWVRTGESSPYEDGLPGPEGSTNTVRQTVTMETGLDVMPAVAQPVSVEGDAVENTRVTRHGQIQPDGPMIEGDAYNVESEVVDATADELRNAGTEYDDEITEHYLQRPETTSGAFDERTAEIVADAETPYDKAATIEEYLQQSKGYSLEVERPDGDIAEEFLLEMDEGYCVYFATAMVQMLRAEEVPARYAVGYTSGQQVDDNEWVVRGLNAHAWVEVYFPDHGWVEFDPTPSDPRDDTRAERIQDAREGGESGVDTETSENESVEEDVDNATPIEDPDEPGDSNDTPEAPGQDPPDGGSERPDPGTTNGGAGSVLEPGTADGTGGGAESPPDEESTIADWIAWLTLENAALGLAVLVGLAAGAHRSGATAHARRTVRLHWRGFRETPEADADRAYRRLEILLARKYRPRKRSESVRAYLAALSDDRDLDPRVRLVGERYELARYGGGIDREGADEALEAVDSLAREELPLLGRLWRNR